MSLIGGQSHPFPVGANQYRYSFSAVQAVHQSVPSVQYNSSEGLPNKARGNSIITSDESFPPSHLSHLARRVQDSDVSMMRCSNWTGNDETNRNHYGAVNLNKTPLRIRLSWKKS